MKISIVLEALTGSFDTDLDKSASKAEKRLDKLAGEFDRRFKIVAGAVAAGTAAVAFFLDRQAEKIAKFQDLSETIGDTAENIASLQLAADVASTSIDDVAAAAVKLTARLVDVKKPTDGVAVALAALGLNFEEFKKLSPVNQIESVAKALAKFEDGASKTAVAVELFGKSGASLLPFLKELAGDTGRVTRLTQEQIEAVDAAGDAVARLKSEVGLMSEALAARMIVALEPAIKGTRNWVDSLNDLDVVAGDLAADNSLVEFTQNTALGLAIVAETLVAIAKLFRAIVGSFESVVSDISLVAEFLGRGAVLGLALESNREALSKALDERNETVRHANERWSDLWNYNATALSDSIRASIEEARRGTAELGDVLNLASILPPSAPLPGLGTTVGEQAIPFRTGSGPADAPPLVFSPGAAGGEEDKALKEHEKALERVRDQVLLTNDAEGELAQMRAMVNELYAQGKIPQDAYLAFLEESSQKLDDAVDETDKATDQMTVFWETAARNAQSAFADFLFDPFKDGLAGMLDSFMATLRRMAAEALAAQIFESIGFGKEGGGAASLASFFGGGKASGGDVVPGKWYMVGEEGPEPFIPKTAGTILPTGSMKMGNNVSITMNMDNRGADPASAANLARAAEAISRETERRVYETLRRDIALVTP